MTLISDSNFIVVDVETTGNNAVDGRMTEVGSIVVRDFQIVDTYTSLINPHQFIPWNIQRVTGISNKMVANAPEEYEISQKIYEHFSNPNPLFVAHNVDFDWSFISETLNRTLGVSIDIPKICTLKLARKLLPNWTKKNVGALEEYFNIPVVNRHRAYDDAFATAHFFIEMLYILINRYNFQFVEEIVEFQDAKSKKSKIDFYYQKKIERYKNIAPTNSGVISFIGNNDEVLYIDKAMNIKQYMDYFLEQAANSVTKIRKVMKLYHRIDWIETFNDLDTNIIFHRNCIESMPTLMRTPKRKTQAIDENITKNKDNSHTMIALLSNSIKEKTIEVYFIRDGFYVDSVIVGARANLDKLYESINKYLYSPLSEDLFSDDYSEIKYVNTWLSKYQTIMTKIYVKDKSEEKLCNEVEKNIKNFYKPVDTDPPYLD